MSNFDQEVQSQLQDIGQSARRHAAAQSRVALAGLRPKRDDGKPGSAATVDDKLKAIQDIYDMQEKTNIQFIILGDLAKAIKDKQEQYDGDVIQLGFNVSNLVPEIKSLFKTWGFEETDYGYKYYFTPPIKWDVKIPVEIHCFKKKYTFFENPDIGFFGVDEYRIPNPFDVYWKYRNEVK